MKTGVQVLQEPVRSARSWLDAVAQRLNLKSRTVALQSLRATLHAIRGQLEPAQVRAFGNELPLVLRGLFYEGWDPQRAPPPAMSREILLGRVEDEFFRAPRLKPERAAKAALEVICARVPAAALAPVVERLPEDLRTLWPDEPAPYTDLRRARPLPPDIEGTRKSRSSPSRLRRATRRGPGDVTPNALPERHGARRREKWGRSRMI